MPNRPWPVGGWLSQFPVGANAGVYTISREGWTPKWSSKYLQGGLSIELYLVSSIAKQFIAVLTSQSTHCRAIASKISAIRRKIQFANISCIPTCSNNHRNEVFCQLSECSSDLVSRAELLREGANSCKSSSSSQLTKKTNCMQKVILTVFK